MTDITVTTEGGTTVTTAAAGPNGIGLPAGGTTGQVAAKASDDDFDIEWVTGGGGGGLTQEQIEDFLGTAFIVGGTNVTVTYDDGADTLTFAVSAFPWASLTGVPSEFTPEAHTHPTSQITGLDAALAALLPTATYSDHTVDTEAHGISAFGAGLVSSVDAAAARTALALGTAATAATGDFDPAGTATAAVAAHNASVSGVHGISAFGATLVDDANAAAARSTLGLGTAATSNTTAFAAASHTHAASAINSGTFANARISQASVTQHQAALSIAESQIPDSTILRRFTDTERLYTYNKAATGLESPVAIPMNFSGVILSARFALTASDTGTATIRVRNSSGTVVREGTVSISAAQYGLDDSITWTTGADGAFTAGQTIEVEPTSGFSASDARSTISLFGTRSN